MNDNNIQPTSQTVSTPLAPLGVIVPKDAPLGERGREIGAVGREIGAAVVTGASGAVGKAATLSLAKEGYTVIMACRNLKKSEEVRQDILKEVPDAKLELMHLELSSPSSIRSFVHSLEGRQIDLLFCNAGIKAHKFTLTEDGIEQNFAVNFLGNALLCRLMIPLMVPHARICNMVSLTTRFAHMDENWQSWGAKDFGQLKTYSRSKLAFLLFTIALAKHHPDLLINVADPGIVDSNMITMGHWYDPLADIFFRPFIKTAEQGAYPALQALHSNERLKYFVGNKIKEIPTRFLNDPLVDKLWKQTNDL